MSGSVIHNSQFVMKFYRSACFGTCPEYSIFIFRDLSYLVEGTFWKAHTRESKNRVEGKVKSKLKSKKQFNRLLEIFEECIQFGTDFVSGTETCGGKIYDVPTVQMCLNWEGKEGYFDHNAYCPNAPAYLVDREEEIDTILQTGKIIKEIFRESDKKKKNTVILDFE
jgi:hypothetical protein